MPKPLLLSRPSGLYVCFRVPTDLREQVGSRFIVRSLGSLRGDGARLVAAAQAVALSKAFDWLRRGKGMVDAKKLLESAQRAVDAGEARPWTASNVRVGGIEFGTVTTNGPEDTQDFLEALKLAEQMSAKIFGPTPPAAAAPIPAGPPSPPAPLLSEEIANHLADLERRNLGPETITESRHTLRILLEVAGDVPVSQITRNHIRAFREAIRWWPRYATTKPQYRGLSFQEIIECGRAEQVPPPAKHTRNKHRQRLGVFFNALVEADVIAKSPLKGTGGEIDTSTDLDTGRPFTDDELVQIFDPATFVPWASKYPHRWWGPMIGLYTGARVTGVAQLYIEDIRQIDGVWGLFFWKNARGQKMKTQSSIRFVPLAKPLLDAGFLDFVADMRKVGHPRLFPHLPAGTRKDGTPNGLGYGRQLSRQFAAYLRGLGIEKGVGFHAFRHTMSTKLAEAGVEKTTIALITGHARRQEVPTLEKHYIHIADVKTLAERVAAVERFEAPVQLSQQWQCVRRENWANAHTHP